ncbi:MAG: HAMP domain-containing histidine kinase [Lachnospiraceae bacterium]|nr:HAMP domain-containing histidine kinase [Lachnospiraceae bacterium]
MEGGTILDYIHANLEMYEEELGERLEAIGYGEEEIRAAKQNWYGLSDAERLVLVNRLDMTGAGQIMTVVLKTTAEISIYPGQTCLVTYDFLQQKEVQYEEIALADLYERGIDLLNRYYELANRFDTEKTNLRYLIYEESSLLRQTNDETNADEISNFEKYISYDNDTHIIKSNFTKTDLNLWNLDYLASSLVGVHSGASFTIGLDTRYLVADDYKLMAEGFARCRPVLLLSLFAIVIGMVGSILFFIYLMASVGHREGHEEICLDKFDRWPTEPAAFLIIGGIIIFVSLCGWLAGIFAKSFFTSRHIYTVMQIVSVAISVIIGLIGFFSLVKRLKAGIVWKNSLLRKMCAVIRKWGRALIRNWPTSGKTAAVIIVYWVITIPLCMFITINRFWGSFFFYVTGIIVFVGVQVAAAGLILWAVISRRRILEGVERISGGDLEYVISDEGMLADDKRLVEAVNNIGAGFQDAVDTAVKSERMKADLITNVSHDIKTPLTSIINYVDLMKRENIEDETLKRYLEVLDQKSQRLKNLTEDLVEASRASSGNINLQLERINFVELVKQACGEFSEKFQERGLTPVTSFPEYSLHVIADGRRVWRILENLFQNTKKYAMPGTRVYISVVEVDDYATFMMKNISESQLNITPEELTERFTRGDTSRTTEGSGLGLSIAKSLTEIQGGAFEIYLNGDLFQVTVQLELAEEEPEETLGEDFEEEMDGVFEPEEDAAGNGISENASGETEDDLGFLDEEFSSADAAGEEGGCASVVGEVGEGEAEREARFLQEALEELESSGLRWRNKDPKAE